MSEDLEKIKKQELVDILIKKIETARTHNLQGLVTLAKYTELLIDEVYKDVNYEMPYKKE